MPVMNVVGQTVIIILYNDEKIGYGAVKGNENIKDRNTVFEFLHNSFLPDAYPQPLFQKLLSVSGATFIECQSNDMVLNCTVI
jgi:hypothetical protein